MSGHWQRVMENGVLFTLINRWVWVPEPPKAVQISRNELSLDCRRSSCSEINATTLPEFVKPVSTCRKEPFLLPPAEGQHSYPWRRSACMFSRFFAVPSSSRYSGLVPRCLAVTGGRNTEQCGSRLLPSLLSPLCPLFNIL